MYLKSILLSSFVCSTAILLITLVHQVDSKGGGRPGSRPGGSGSRPGGSGSRPVISKPPYKPSGGSSSKGFGTKKVIAVAAGAYIGGKAVKKVNENL